MTPLTAVAALLGLPIYFYLPGLLIERGVWRGSPPVRGLELQIMRVLVSLLLCGWVGFLLAELGVWSLPALLVGVGAVALPAFLYRVWRERPAMSSTGRLHIVAPMPRARPRFSVAALTAADWALLAIGLVFALLVARPFEVVRGGLDAGVYPLTGFSIARTGGIVVHDPLIAEIARRAEAGEVDAQHVMGNFLAPQDPVRFIATRLRSSGFFINAGEWAEGRIVPQFFHLWPVWIATATAFGGSHTGLLATGGWALLGVLLIGLLGRRLAHPLVGVGAAAFLALNSVQVWFGRMPVSEALAQALTLAGLWAFSHFADEPRGRAGVWWGALAGVAIGQLALARIDFFWAVGPALLFLLYIAVTHRWRAGHTAMALALALLLLHAALHVVFIARAYFFDTGYSPLGQVSAIVEWFTLPFITERMRVQMLARPLSALRYPWRLPLEIALLVAFAALLVFLWRRPRPIRAGEAWLIRHRARLLGALALVFGLLAFYGYIIRPQIVDAELLRAPFSPAARARLAGYIGAPIAVPQGMKETVARDQANVVRFGWYVSPLGVILGVIGGLLLWRRGLDRRSWLCLLVATAYALFYFKSLYGTGGATYIYILRRFVPAVLPAWSLAMAYALWCLAHGRRWRWPRRGLAAGLGLLLVLFFGFTGRNVYAHVEYAGAIQQFAVLARLFEPDDVILIRGGGADVSARDATDIVAGPLTFLHGLNALTFKGSNPIPYADALAGQVARWTGEGRAVYVLLSASGGDWRFPGWVAVPQTDWTWSFREFQQLQDQKPYAAGPGSITFRLYRLEPAAPSVPGGPSAVTPADPIAQVAGFHRAESDGGAAFAWTAAQAMLRLHAPTSPGLEQSRLRLHVAPGPRPRVLPAARLCVDIAPEVIPYPDNNRDNLAWQSLGCHDVVPPATELLLPTPALTPGQPYLVRLTTDPWTPSALPPDPGDPPSADGRSLGVRWLEAALINRQ